MKKLIKKARNAIWPGVLILLYHRVAELSPDPQLLGVRPSRFLEHLEVCRKVADVISLRSLVKWLGRPRIRRPGIVITFDDGYSDNLHSAKPLMERLEIPATVFVSTGFIGNDRELWWDELERIFLGSQPLPEILSLEIDGVHREWRLAAQRGKQGNHLRASQEWNVLDRDDPSERHSIYRILCRTFGSLPEKERQRLMGKLRTWAGVGSSGRSTHRLLSGQEIADLAAGGLVEVGAHTVTHPVLSTLSEEEQRKEIRDSKSALENILGRGVGSFSYPFGLLHDYSADTVSIVKDAGFDCACANYPGVARPGADLFQLPRMVVRDWEGGEFERRLRDWFGM
jgi:peptidoglycan/xylan/chitin deacetylase (PgdA/CDA1 family)